MHGSLCHDACMHAWATSSYTDGEPMLHCHVLAYIPLQAIYNTSLHGLQWHGCGSVIAVHRRRMPLKSAWDQDGLQIAENPFAIMRLDLALCPGPRSSASCQAMPCLYQFVFFSLHGAPRHNVLYHARYMSTHLMITVVPCIFW